MLFYLYSTAVAINDGARAAASALPGNLLKMQNVGPYSSPAESETLGVWDSEICFSTWFNKPSRWFWCILTFKDAFSIQILHVHQSLHITEKDLDSFHLPSFLQNMQYTFVEYRANKLVTKIKILVNSNALYTDTDS